MIRLFISFCLTLLVLGSLTSQNSNLVEVKENGLWGLYDFVASEVVLEPQYDLIGQRSVWGIQIIKDDLVGIVSNSGEMISEPRFLEIRGGVDNCYKVVLTDSTNNIIDTRTSKVILPVDNYSFIQPINENYFFVGIDGKHKVIDRNGKFTIDKIYQDLSEHQLLKHHILFKNKKNQQGLIRLSDGKEIIPAIYKEIIPIDSTYSKVRKDSSGYQIINHEINKIIIKDKYANAETLGKEYVILEDANGKQHIYHTKSKQQFQLATFYNHFKIIDDNFIRVKKGSYSGLINHKGGEIIPVEYELINALKINSKSNLFLLKKHGVSGIYNPITKKEILPIVYSDIKVTDEQFILVDHPSGKGLYNKYFEQLLKPEYNRIQIKNNSIKARKEKSVEIYWLDKNQRITEQEDYKEFYTLRIGYKKSAIIDSGPKREKKIITFPDINFEWVKQTNFSVARAYKAITSDSILSEYIYRVNEETGTHFSMVQNADILVKRNTLIKGLCNKKHGFNPFLLFDGNKGKFMEAEQRFLGFRFDDFKRYDLPKMAVILEDGTFGMIAQDGTWLLDENNQPLRASYIEEMKNGMIRYAIGGEWTIDKDTVKTINSNFEIRGKKIFTGYYLNQHYSHSSWQDKCYLMNAKWGYIDSTCQIIIPAQYEHAAPFNQGKAIVGVDGKIGCINKENKFIQAPEYSNIVITQHGTLILEKKNTDNINYRMKKNGSQIFNDRYSFSDQLIDGLRRVRKSNLYGCINEIGDIAIPLEFDSLGNFNEGYALARKGSTFFIINQSGKEFLKNTTFNIKSAVFHELILVEKNNKYGFIDINGKVIIPIKFTLAFPFQKEGLARVVVGRKTGLIDNTGHFVLNPKDYELVFPFDENGLAIVQHVQYGVKGIINTNGTAIIKPFYEEIESFKNGYAIVQKDNKFGFINLEGKEVIPTVNYQVTNANENIMAIKEGIYDFWEFRDSTNTKINNLQFTKPAMYRDGHAIITVVTDTQSYHRCLVNIKGDTLFFSDAENQIYAFNEGIMGVRRKTKFNENITKVSFHFKKLGEHGYRGKSGGYRALTGFHDNVAIVRPTTNYGLLDVHGNYITSLKYKYIVKNPDHSYTTVPEKLYGYADKDGQIILPVEYDYLDELIKNSRHIIHLEKGDQIGYMDTKGNWIWDMTR